MRNSSIFCLSLLPALWEPSLLSQAEEHYQVTAANILEIHTPPPQITLPVYQYDSYKTARVWFLPDWQSGGNIQSDSYKDPFSNRSQEIKGGDRQDISCAVYGLTDHCDWPKVSGGKVSPYQNLSCESSCICDSTFKYDKSNSPEDRWTLGDETCDGKHRIRQAKPCPNAYTPGLSDCLTKTHPEGWLYHQEGYSGNDVCGQCTAVSCREGGFQAGLNDCSGEVYPSGWNYEQKGYAGDEACGKCTAKECRTGYAPGTETCSDGWDLDQDKTVSYAGNSICGRCSISPCADGYTAGLNDCSEKAEAYYWKYDSYGKSGNKVCGRCSEMTCAEKNALCRSGTQNLDYYYADSALRCLMK